MEIKSAEKGDKVFIIADFAHERKEAIFLRYIARPSLYPPADYAEVETKEGTLVISVMNLRFAK